MTRKKSGEVFSLMDDSAAEAEPGASEADHEPATRSGQPVPVMSQRDQNRSLRFADSASPGVPPFLCQRDVDFPRKHPEKIAPKSRACS